MIALIDHGFDGEGHTFFQLHATAGFTVVQYLRFFVHFAANTVAGIFAYYAEACAFGNLLNGLAYIAETGAGAYLTNAGPHRLIGGIDQTPGLWVNLADAVHFAGIGNKTVFFQGDIEIDNITVAQQLAGFGHAVANHMIHRWIQHIGKIVLPLAGRSRLQIVDDKVFDPVVDIHGADAGFDVVIKHGKHLRQQAS